MGTPFCMLPVTSLDSVPIGDGKVEVLFNSLLRAWGNNVGVNIAEQIHSWASRNQIKGPTPYHFKSR